MGMTVKGVMTRDVEACEPNATVRDAAVLMARKDVEADIARVGKDAKTGELVEEISS